MGTENVGNGGFRFKGMNRVKWGKTGKEVNQMNAQEAQVKASFQS